MHPSESFRRLLRSLVAAVLWGAVAVPAAAHEEHGEGDKGSSFNEQAAEAAQMLPPNMSGSITGGRIGCSGGLAAGYPCQGVDLLAHLPLQAMGGGTANQGNDIWGWTSPVTGIDYALVGRTHGTAFVDLSDPVNPIFLGTLLRTSGTSTSAWRDIKVYNDHAFVVADFSSNQAHGMQVFDLTQLDAVDRASAVASPLSFSETARYTGFGRSHNVAINEETGFAYAVGTNTFSGGLHFVDIRNPASPVAAGGFSGDGYTHDTQVVVYDGPDAAFVGRELAFSSNENTLTIVDVTQKSSPVMLSRTTYPLSSYAHQGWLTPDQRYFLMNDELDELNRSEVNRTRTHIWDVSDLSAPQYLGFEPLKTTATDHNLFIYGGLAFEANYNSGLRILDTRDIRNGDLYEVGWFDIVPGTNAAGFDGAWSVYHFEGSGVTIVNGINQGLFVLDASSIVAGSPTMGVMNGSFELVERGNLPVNIPVDNLVLFRGTGQPVGGAANRFDLDIHGWVGPIARAGVWHLSAADFPSEGGAADGDMALFIRSNLAPVTVRQTLADILEQDTLYTLSVQVGQSTAHTLSAGYDVALYAGNNLLAQILDSDLGAPVIPIGSWELVQLLVDSRDFESLLGLPLEIRLSSRILQDVAGDGITFFDMVALHMEPVGAQQAPSGIVPEPGTLLLALLGLSAAPIRRGRRKF